MKKAVTKFLYVLFFLLVTVILTACTIFVVQKLFQTSNTAANDMSAILISQNSIVQDNEDVSKIEYDVSDFEKKKYGYLSLQIEGQTTLYDKIEAGIYYLSTEKDANGHYRTARFRLEGVQLSEGQIRQTVNAFIYDHPEIFWLENLFGYTFIGEDTLVEFYSVLSADECQTAIHTFTSTVQAIANGIDDNLSAYEKEKAVHNYLVRNCTYKSGVNDATDGWQYFSAYGALINGEAVCEGYAKAFEVLLSMVGIESHTIRGQSHGVGHMWNIVKLNNQWYHVDTTWDDTEDKESYEYFNLSSEYIQKDHTINTDIQLLDSSTIESNVSMDYNFFVPVADSMDLNYYQMDALHFSAFDEKGDQDFVTALVNAAQKHERYLYIVFDGSLSYTEYINTLFYESPYKFYYYVQTANEQLSDEYKIDKNGMSILKNESSNTLRISLAYEVNE